MYHVILRTSVCMYLSFCKEPMHTCLRLCTSLHVCTYVDSESNLYLCVSVCIVFESVHVCMYVCTLHKLHACLYVCLHASSTWFA